MIPYAGPPSQYGKRPPINNVGGGSRSNRRHSRRKWCFIWAVIIFIAAWLPDPMSEPSVLFIVFAGVLLAFSVLNHYLIKRDHD
jgi:hypothetical protein